MNPFLICIAHGFTFHICTPYIFKFYRLHSHILHLHILQYVFTFCSSRFFYVLLFFLSTSFLLSPVFFWFCSCCFFVSLLRVLFSVFSSCFFVVFSFFRPFSRKTWRRAFHRGNLLLALSSCIAWNNIDDVRCCFKTAHVLHLHF